MFGGGANGGTLYNCTLTGNEASHTHGASGGGAYGSTLYDCVLTGNRASGSDSPSSWSGVGGGAAASTLYNCLVSGNSAIGGGGGASSTLYNCVITGNSTWSGGGGAAGSTLYNCVVSGNSAYEGGGAYGSTLYNSIVYYNTAPKGANYSSATFNYSCASPLPLSGVGNTSANPQLASASHLSTTSPCIGAGSAAFAQGVDIDGEPWASRPSMGADELVPGNATGPLSMSIMLGYTNFAAGFPVLFIAHSTGRITRSVWDFADGTLLTNQAFASHAWTIPGTYTVKLTGHNDGYPAGVSTTIIVEVIGTVHYVNAANPTPAPPYASWTTAATNIQSAIDAGTAAGRLVLVTNGVYQGGVAVPETARLRSVDGPAYTVINGGGLVRCVFLGSNSVLSGFTLTNGFAGAGGGVWCESSSAVVSNCVLTGNSASAGSPGGGSYGVTLYNCILTGNSAEYGGGADASTLYNCTLTGNSARGGGGAYNSSLYNCAVTGNSGVEGGGASSSTLYNCTVSGNSASGGWGGYGGGTCSSTLYNCTVIGNSAQNDGGGTYCSTLFNCIVYFNSSTNGANHSGCSVEYSCTTPLPFGEIGNIDADPMFVEPANGDFRLRPDSPCINAGLNDYASSPADLDGLPRIVSGTVDIGAYEFQGPGSLISYAWLQQYGLPTDGSADATDPDTDGLTTWQEWRCQTNPTNALSALRLLSASRTNTNVTVTWQSVAGVTYFLERSVNLGASPPFTLLATAIPGQPGTTSYTDTTAASFTPLFYRVGVSP
jgi:PKD repeat protein